MEFQNFVKHEAQCMNRVTCQHAYALQALLPAGSVLVNHSIQKVLAKFI